MKKLLAIVVTCILLLTSGCTFASYLGPHNGLYSVAAYNVLTTGSAYSEKISVVEEDSYGRTLFYYRNVYSSFYDGKVDALGICQKFDDTNTYYYEDICIVLCGEDGEISEDKLAHLKEVNDWEQELDLSKMVSSPIMLHELAKPAYSKELSDYAEKAIVPTDGYRWLINVVNEDDLGQQLIVLRELSIDSNQGLIGRAFAVIVKPDGSVDEEIGIMEMDDEMLQDYTEAIMAFKARNNWTRNAL